MQDSHQCNGEVGQLPDHQQKVGSSFNAHHAHWFLEGQAVVAGKTLQAFATKEKWQGLKGMDGRRVEIELSLGTAADRVCTAVEDKLPDGSQLGCVTIHYTGTPRSSST